MFVTLDFIHQERAMTTQNAFGATQAARSVP